MSFGVTVLNEEPGTDDHWCGWLVIEMDDKITWDQFFRQHLGRIDLVVNNDGIDEQATLAAVASLPHVVNVHLATHAGYFRNQ